MATEQQAARTVLPADATQVKLFEVLTHEPTHVDEICAITNLPVAQVLSSLALMVLKGLVRQVAACITLPFENYYLIIEWMRFEEIRE